MDYQEFEPAADLKKYVRCIWSLRGTARAGEEPDAVFPDGCPELIINFADPFRTRVGNDFVEQPLTMLVGQITEPFVVGPTYAADILAVRFEPFGGSILSDNMASITNNWADVERMLMERAGFQLSAVRSAGSYVFRVTAVEDLVRTLIRRDDAAYANVELAVTRIRESHGAMSLDKLAAELRTTSRTLQRQFLKRVGVTPKLFARITRFQRVFSSWKADPQSLSRVAAECGYFDQSHLIRDFRDFAGSAPAAMLEKQPEFTSFFLPK